MNDDESASADPMPTPRDSMDRWFRPHVGLVVTGIIFLWVIVNVLRATDGDVTSALAVLAASGAVTVSLGVLAASFGLVIAILFFTVDILRTYLRDRDALSRSARNGLYLSQLWLGLLAFFYLPLANLLLYAFVYVLAIVGIRRGWNRGPKSTGEMAQLLIIGLVPLLLVSSPAATVWLPSEALVINGGAADESVVVGYALDDSEGWFTYLDEETRAVIRIASADIVDREICSQRSNNVFLTPLLRSGNASDLPDCP